MHSKNHLDTVDDSLHVMMKKDKKKRQKDGGSANAGYIPRAPHPLMSGPVAEEPDDDSPAKCSKGCCSDNNA